MKNELQWFLKAGEVAQKALCVKAKCGAVIVKESVIIGQGYNAPPKDGLEDARCLEKNSYDRTRKPKSDSTCCMHVEWRAIIDALKNSENLSHAVLYFVRVNEKGELLTSGDPYCTVCSRLALDVGLAQFGLLHESGPMLYETKTYNKLSYTFHHKPS